MTRRQRIPALSMLAILALAAPAPAEEAVPRVPQLTVTATRNPRELESLTGTAEVVERDDIDLRGAWTVEEALLEVPGVEVVGSSRYGQEVRFNTRGVVSGYGTQRTLVLLDGRPLTDEYLGNVDLAQYPLSAMRRIEFVRGPASSVYGTNAMGGVLNLIPMKGTSVPTTRFSAEGGTFGTGRASLSHGNRFGHVDFFLALEGTETNGYLRNSRNDPMDWETRSAFLNAGIEEDDLELRLYLSMFHGEGTDEDFDRDIDRNLQDLSFRYTFDPAKDAELRVRLYRSQSDQTLDWFERPESPFDLLSFGAIVTQTFRVFENHLLTGGIEWRREEAMVEEAAGTVDESASTFSLFVQDEIDVTDDLSVILGLRYDDRTGIDSELSWRVGANWKVMDGTTIRAALGRAYRAPTISDQFLPETAYFGVTFMGNPGLEPETLISAELGVDQRLHDGVWLGITAFASRYDDFWDFLPDQSFLFTPQNIAGVDIHGLETTLAADLGEGFSAAISYTLTDATYDEFEGNEDVEGNRIDDNVKHRGSATLAWRHPDGHAVRFGLIVSGDRPTDPENTISEKLDGFYVAELQGVARVTDWAALTLNVQNVFNHGYRTRPEFRQPGRAIFLGLRIDL